MFRGDSLASRYLFSSEGNLSSDSFMTCAKAGSGVSLRKCEEISDIRILEACVKPVVGWRYSRCLVAVENINQGK